MIDDVRTSLIIGSIAAVIALVCAAYIAWENTGSRNVVLAASTFWGAAIFLGLNLFLDLRTKDNKDFITAEITVDRVKPQIRQWNYGSAPPQRLIRETTASDRYFAGRPGPFIGDRDKLVHDLIVFSLISYLATEQRDWQSRPVYFTGSMGIVTTSSLVSKPEECTIYTDARLRNALLDANNDFANVPMPFRGPVLCVPPNSIIEARSNSLKIVTPFCSISFALESSGAVFYYEPGNSLNQPKLADGEPALESRQTGIRVMTTFSALRANHRDMQKYQEWSARVVAGAKAWFESAQQPYQPSRP